MKKQLILGLTLWILSSALFSKEDTLVVALGEASIMSSRLENYAVGSKRLIVDSSSLRMFENRNLSDLLSSESSLFIKSYGLGSLASSSFRGGNASQTAVLWNGLPLNSSMNGILDFSLVPVVFFDQVGIHYGGESAQWGSGALGGAIHLNNPTRFGKGNTYQFGASLGSFGLNTQLVKANLSRKKLRYSLTAFRSAAKNDFAHYKQNQFGKDSLYFQDNANYLVTGVLSSIDYLLSKNQKIQGVIWYQQTDRAIPPLIFEPFSKSYQQDNSIRSLITHQWWKKKSKLTTKLAYFKEEIEYQDSVSSIFASNLAHTLLSEINFEHEFSRRLSLNTGLINSYLIASTSNYEQRIAENQLSWYASWRYSSKNRRLNAVGSGRMILVNEQLVTPVFSIQSTYRLLNFFSVKGKASTVYRLPTLNDKYWTPGGNRTLSAEQGHGFEFGLLLNSAPKKKGSITTEITFFNKRINNWIAWLPNGSFWTPQNLKEVWSRGAETNTLVSLKKSKYQLHFQLMTNYVLSTNEVKISENDNSQGKQLIYTPRYSGFAKVTFTKKELSLSYRHNYTGYSFTSSDNLNYLTPFDLGAVRISYEKLFSRFVLDGSFSIENIWGEEYFRVANRPMPLINYSFGLNFKINQPIKTTNN